ncbi:hypothetical protein AB0N06_32875 [Streptomyces sp. NPDC051020]|uniref:hypothetical protein n=1 Tax=Streptomyces sp. NPDC051020 TaxID=3155409 RepID=UPI00341B4E11
MTVGTGGRSTLVVSPATGPSDAFTSVEAGGDRYVIPSEAAPYAGRMLDMSLFGVTKLAAAAPQPNAHIPVRLSFAPGVTPAGPAGVTFT